MLCLLHVDKFDTRSSQELNELTHSTVVQVLLDLLQKLHSFYVAAPAVDDPLAAIFQFKF
jgi:hypothetical protein